MATIMQQIEQQTCGDCLHRCGEYCAQHEYKGIAQDKAACDSYEPKTRNEL